jgi:hypothetical protein
MEVVAPLPLLLGFDARAARGVAVSWLPEMTTVPFHSSPPSSEHPQP